MCVCVSYTVETINTRTLSMYTGTPATAHGMHTVTPRRSPIYPALHSAARARWWRIEREEKGHGRERQTQPDGWMVERRPAAARRLVFVRPRVRPSPVPIAERRSSLPCLFASQLKVSISI